MNFITKSKARQKSAEVYEIEDIVRLKKYQCGLIDELLYLKTTDNFKITNDIISEIRLIEVKLKRLAEEIVMNNNRKFAQ